MCTSVVIVNYKTANLTIDCLQSLELEVNANLEVLAVDNASNDNSMALFDQEIKNNKWHQVKTLGADFNGGFSFGNNIGINASASEFFLLLNSDTIVYPGAVDLLIKTLQENPDMGMASPRLEWPDGTPQESCFRFHRPINELIRSAATGPITRLFKRYEVPLRVSDNVIYPEWTSFA